MSWVDDRFASQFIIQGDSIYGNFSAGTVGGVRKLWTDPQKVALASDTIQLTISIKPRETFRFVIENENIDRFLASFVVLLNDRLLPSYIVTGKTPKTIILARFKNDMERNRAVEFRYINEEPLSTCCIVL